MRIKSFTIENYRSIIEAYKIELNQGLTVLVGKNNEGKSNILRALNIAFEVITKLKDGLDIHKYFQRNYYSLSDSDRWYNWKRDFPITKQSSKKFKNKKTIFNLTFLLDENERSEFYECIGSSCNEYLPFIIRFDNKNSIEVDIPKKSYAGRGNFKEKKEKIAEFIANHFDTIYIPAIRTDKLSIDIISNIIQKGLNSSLDKDQEYSNALNIIKNKYDDIAKKTEEQIALNLKSFIPNFKSIEIDINSRQSNRIFINPQIRINDGVTTLLEYKGDGLKSLVALGIMNSLKTGSITVAIEEPESHLHPDAIRKLKMVIENIAKNQQVIITTHSPIMINRDNLKSNIIIAKNHAEVCESIKKIRDELGVITSDNLISATHIILVEGVTDQKSLTAILIKKSEIIKKSIQSGKLVISNIGGTKHLYYNITKSLNDLCKTMVLVDDDQAGREAITKSKAILNEKDLFLTTVTGNIESEFEDYINPDIYKNLLKEQYGVNIDALFTKSKEKWSKKIEKLFDRSMKQFNDKTLENIKIQISKLVENSKEEVLKYNMINTFNNFINNIETEFLK